MNNTVKDFYSNATGWNMFDGRYLTQPVSEFISAEHVFIDELFKTCSKYKGIIEIGCGYGRFMNWASSNEVDYDGLDLVPWLVDIGILRQQKLGELLHPGRYRVHNLPAEDMGKVLGASSYSRKPNKLIIFPFNCFGNIANLKEVMKALAESGQDVLISTYRTDPETSALRKAYYRKCGFTQVEIQRTSNGILLTSAEGLHAIAYDEWYLRLLFEEYGYELTYKVDLGAIGLQYHFKSRSGRERSYESSSISQTVSRQIQELVEPPYIGSDEASWLNLSALRDEVSTSTSNGNLLMFESCVGFLQDADNSSLVVRAARKVPEGTIVRVALCKQKIDVAVCATTVETVTHLAGDNEFEMKLKFFKPNPVMSAWWLMIASQMRKSNFSIKNAA